MVGLNPHLETEIAKLSCSNVALKEGGLLAHECEDIYINCTGRLVHKIQWNQSKVRSDNLVFNIHF